MAVSKVMKKEEKELAENMCSQRDVSVGRRQSARGLAAMAEAVVGVAAGATTMTG